MNVLVVSQNSSLIFNIKEWFENDIKNGKIRVDFAKDRKTAERLLEDKAYDKIFHNGIYIIDAIEKYQSNVDVIHYGRPKNNIYSSYVEKENKRDLVNTIKKPLYFGVNMKGIISGIITIITVIYSVSAFMVNLRKDVDHNLETIAKVEKKTEIMSKGIENMNISLGVISTKLDALSLVKDKKSNRRKNE